MAPSSSSSSPSPPGKPSMTMMPLVSLRSSARRIIESYAEDRPDRYDPADVYRAFLDEASLLYRTQTLKDNFALDPYERLRPRCVEGDDDDDDDIGDGSVPDQGKLDAFLGRIGVTDYHHVETKAGYVYTQAEVTIADGDGDGSGSERESKSSTATTTTALTFRYERDSAGSRRDAHPPPSKPCCDADGCCCGVGGSPPGKATAEAAASGNAKRRNKGAPEVEGEEKERLMVAGGGSGGSGGSGGATVRYTIEMSQNFGPARPLLWVDVEAAGSYPSSAPAVNVEDALLDQGEGGDHDNFVDGMVVEEEEGRDGDNGKLDEEGERHQRKPNKKRRRDGSVSGDDEAEAGVAALHDNGGIVKKSSGDRTQHPCSSGNECSRASSQKRRRGDDDQGDDDDEEEEGANVDRFVAGIDPDVLASFLEVAKLGEIDDDVAFFLLATFPFFESEWDLVGFVLDAVFGPSDEDGDDSGSGDEPKWRHRSEEIEEEGED